MRVTPPVSSGQRQSMSSGGPQGEVLGVEVARGQRVERTSESMAAGEQIEV